MCLTTGINTLHCEHAIILSIGRSINFNLQTKFTDKTNQHTSVTLEFFVPLAAKIFNPFYAHNGMRSATYTRDIEFQQQRGGSRRGSIFTREHGERNPRILNHYRFQLPVVTQ